MRRKALRRPPLLGAFSVAALFNPVCALYAQETTTYEYDALGRLVETTISDSGSQPTEVDIAYDDAGNRVSVDVAGALPQRNLRVVPIAGGKVVVVIE